MKYRHFIILLFVISAVIAAEVCRHGNIEQQEKVEQLFRAVREHQVLADFQDEFGLSLNKVRLIISRYNSSMPADQKEEIVRTVHQMSVKYAHLNIDLICATITHESARTWSPFATSRVGAMGLMQIMPATGAFLAAEEGLEWSSAENILYNPVHNIRLGCRYLNALVGMYEQEGGLAAYNGGARRVEMWLAANRNNKVLYAETRKYVPAVLKLYHQFSSERSL